MFVAGHPDAKQAVVPYWFIGASVLALLAIYDVSSPYYITTKQRAWILTTVASAVMTIVSLPFLYDFISAQGSVLDVHSYGRVDIYALRFFQSYLISDLVAGFFSYRDQVNFLSGWFHHSVYIGIVEAAIRHDWSHIFGLCSIMELPTFVLGLGRLYPSLRSNRLFAFTFFTTRILLHATLIVAYALPHNGATSGGSLVPAEILGFLFVLHSFWFYGCLKGFAKRSRSPLPPSSPVQPVTTAASPVAVSSSPLARSRIWRRRRLHYHRRFVTETARRILPNQISMTKIYDLIPPREVVYDVVGLGGRRHSMQLH